MLSVASGFSLASPLLPVKAMVADGKESRRKNDGEIGARPGAILPSLRWLWLAGWVIDTCDAWLARS